MENIFDLFLTDTCSHFVFWFSFQGQKVNVTVFYEVLCPDSKSFILHELYPTWEKVPEIMDIHYRPFGKAHVSLLTTTIIDLQYRILSRLGRSRRYAALDVTPQILLHKFEKIRPKKSMTWFL